jgi:20S proteasome alpha/beta subunit
MRQVLALLIPLLFTPLLHSQSPTRGTINILLANSNGMVLVTDSRASNRLGQKVKDRSQKLFKIDAAMVCSIAGFGSDPGPHGITRETAGARSPQLQTD